MPVTIDHLLEARESIANGLDPVAVLDRLVLMSLTVTQKRVYNILCASETVTARQIHEATGMKHSQISEVLNQLLYFGLVERTNIPAERGGRKYLWRLV